MAHKLQNYLRTYRKRAGLSQDEMAYLLGSRNGTKISRYERFKQVPELTTAFAYEALFDIPPRELFAGIYEQAKKITLRRAHALHRKLSGATQNRLTAQKLAALEKVLGHAAKA